jgi:hypothetical protein
MCEFCGHGGKCNVCGWDQGELPLAGWTDSEEELPWAIEGEDNRNAVGGAVLRERDLTLEELRALDGSLQLDADAAVRELAESLIVGLRYAMSQVRRAGDQLAGVLERVEAVLASTGSEWASV